MALAPTNFGPFLFNNGGGAQGSGPFATGNVDVPANSVVVAIVLCGSEDAEAEADYVADSPNLDWTKHAANDFDFAANNGAIGQVWTALNAGAQLDDEVITITHTGHAGYQFGVCVRAYTGHNASDPVGGVAAGDGTGTTHSLTLSEAPAADDDTFAALFIISGSGDGSGTAVAAGSSFTEITELGSPSSFAKWQTQSRTGSTSDAVSWTSSGSAGSPFDRKMFLAITIKAAAAGVDEVIDVDPGEVAVEPGSVFLVLGHEIAATPGDVAVDPVSLGLLAAYEISATPKAASVDGQAVDLVTGRIIEIDPGEVAIAPQAVTLEFGRQILDATGAVAVTGQAVTLPAAYQIAIVPGEIAARGRGTQLEWSGDPVASGGAGWPRIALKLGAGL